MLKQWVLIRAGTIILLMFIGFNVALAQQIEELQQQLTLALSAQDDNKAIELYYQLASASWERERMDEALSYFEKGATLSMKKGNDQASEFGWYSLGLAQLNLSEYSAAVKSFANSYDAAKARANREGMVKSLLNEARSQQGRGRNRRAVKALEEALNLSVLINNNEREAEAYKLLAENYRVLGDKQKANEYLKRYEALNNVPEERIVIERDVRFDEMKEQIDEVKRVLESKEKTLEQTEDSLRQIQEISEERQLQIDLLSMEKELSQVTLQAKDAELQNNRLIRNSLIIGVVLVGLLAVAIFRGYRSKAKANEYIHRQNMNIKSSINYGQRIQEAMLPHQELFQQLVPESFIFFKPRDVVSGDFYWLHEMGENTKKFAIAAVDCTGHGVPGAFMSMIGMNALNGSISKGIENTDEILQDLHRQIHGSLKQDETGNQDGMDLSLCMVDRVKKKLYFSGAKNHLIYFKDGELIQIRGDRHPIGGSRRRTRASYTRHEIELEEGMFFYLYSDGYVDQFGGKDNMKFMTRRFKTLLTELVNLPVDKQKERLDQELKTWQGDRNQTDDILVIGFSPL